MSQPLYIVHAVPIRKEIVMTHLMKQGVVVQDQPEALGQAIRFKKGPRKTEFLIHDTLLSTVALGREIFPGLPIKITTIGHSEGIVYRIDTTARQQKPFSALLTFKADEEENEWHLTSMEKIPRSG